MSDYLSINQSINTHLQLKKKEEYILQNEKYLPKIADYDFFRGIGKGSFAEVYLGKEGGGREGGIDRLIDGWM